jgi:thioredoxin 1
MILNKIIRPTAYTAAALVIATFIYASVEVSIPQANTPAEFDKILKENKLAVVQFFSPTCGVCLAFKRKGIFQKAAKALPHITFAMTSSEQGVNLHHEYKITAFPTFVFFKNGKEVGRYKGYVETPQFINKVSGIFSAAELKEPATPSEPVTSNQE